ASGTRRAPAMGREASLVAQRGRALRQAGSLTLPGASLALAASTRALHVPFAGGACREPSQGTVRTAPTHPALAIPRGTLPVELTLGADRLRRQAWCRQQDDQGSPHDETMQHRTSRITICAPACGMIWAIDS